jgi:hypothetical protein
MSEPNVEQEALVLEEKRHQQQIGIAGCEAARRRLVEVRVLRLY